MTPLFVITADPGKTYGVSVWEGTDFKGCEVYSDEMPDFEQYRNRSLLLCEGTNFGPSVKYIQRCVGRLEGQLNTIAATVPVIVWRKAVFTDKVYRQTARKKGDSSKWKKLAVLTCDKLGYELPEMRDNHHAAEAVLIGHAFVHHLIPLKKIHGLPVQWYNATVKYETRRKTS